MNTISMNCESRTWLAALIVFAALVAVPAQSQDLGKALETCASIAEDDARLTCFDALAASLVDGQDTEQPDAPTAAPAVVAVVPAVVAVVPAVVDAAPAVVNAAPAVVAATPAAGSVPLTDEVGKERIEQQRAEDREKYASRVMSCQESVQSGQTYFMLENGQVWKQSHYRRLGFRTCEFDVEISKSMFGYSMYIPSKDRRIPVARVK